jgi:hypothetical protein
VALVLFCRRARQCAGPPAAVSHVPLVAGCAIAAMFFRAGRTKVACVTKIRRVT